MITANFHGRTISALAFQNQNQWTQSWSLSPVTDFSDLERLRNLYRPAIRLTDDASKNDALIQSFIVHYIHTQVKGVDTNTQQLAKVLTVAQLNGAAAQGVTWDQMPLLLPVDTQGALSTDPQSWRRQSTPTQSRCGIIDP